MRSFRLVCLPSLGLALTLAPTLATAQQLPATPPNDPGQTTESPSTPAPETGEVPALIRPPTLEVSDEMLDAPAPAPNQIRDWQQALRLIRRNSSDLRRSRAQIEIARAQAQQALAPALPSLTGNAQISRHILLGSGLNIFADPPERTTLPDPTTTWNAGLQLRVPLIASKAWFDHDTARATVDVRNLEAKAQERLIVGNVATAIIQVVTAERAAEVSRVSLRSALSNLELNRRRARLGSASAVDVLRTEQEVARSRAQVIAANETIRQAREALGLALGTSEAWGVAPDVNLNALAEGTKNTCHQEDSLNARLDVRAAEANVDLARRQVQSVDHLYVPTVDGVSNATYWSNSDSTANRESVTWTIGAVLTWNIYDGGWRYGSRRVNEGQLTLARESVADTKRQAAVEVERALRGVRVAEANLKVSTRAAEIARQSARFAQITFLNGTGTSFDMVDTARTQREAELDVTIKEFELLRAKIAAFLALASCHV